MRVGASVCPGHAWGLRVPRDARGGLRVPTLGHGEAAAG